MLVTFYNVEITIEAPTPADAYRELCEVLSGTRLACDDKLEYATDSFDVHDPPKNAPFPTTGSTMLLWPESAP